MFILIIFQYLCDFHMEDQYGNMMGHTVYRIALSHTHSHLQPAWTLSRTTWASRHQKGKTNLDLLEQEIVSGSGISWAIYKSAH